MIQFSEKYIAYEQMTFTPRKKKYVDFYIKPKEMKYIVDNTRESLNPNLVFKGLRKIL